MEIHIYFDGACDNNSKLKFMGIGVHIEIDGETLPDFCHYSMVGSGTSNRAEWEALDKALSIANSLLFQAKYSDADIKIFGDSQIVIKQYNAKNDIHDEILRDYFKKARLRTLKLGMRLLAVSWIPRGENKKADYLSKRGITEYLKELE